MSRVLLIGLDGADPRLVRQWMAEGHLPILSQLAARGCFSPLRSTMPAATFPAWTTAVTGVNPGRHGLIDFTMMPRGTYQLRFLNGADRGAPAIWSYCTRAGKRTAVLGVPATYPPEPVNGIMVSGFDSPVCSTVDPSFVYPRNRFDEVRGWRYVDGDEHRIGPGWHDQMLESILRKIDDKTAIAARMAASERWDFFMAVFGESDGVAHHFWMFHDPQSPWYRPGPEEPIRRVYQRLDTAVGRLIEAMGDDATVGILSDHGSGGVGDGVIHLNNWLAEQGYITFGKGGGSRIKQCALRCVPPAWRGALFRRFKRWADQAETTARFSGIDWAHTLAWSEELNYFPSIRINLKGREPHGQVYPSEYDAFCDALCRKLEAWFPIRKAWRREELYCGPFVDRAPDILLELAQEGDYSFSCLRQRGGDSFQRVDAAMLWGGKEHGLSGAHREHGIFFWSNPLPVSTPSLLDIAPTVLHELGLSADGMEGTPLQREDAVQQPADFSAGIPENLPQESEGYTPEEARIMEERLRTMGYFE